MSISLEQLRIQPQQFDFFQAVRLLEFSSIAAKKIQEPPSWDNPATDPLRFFSSLSLAFPSREIEEIQFSQTQIKMWVNFMGLFGAQGLLPYHYTELLLQRVQDKDFALRDFYDLFNHRLLVLFYLSWKKTRFFVQREQGRKADSLTAIIDVLTGKIGDTTGENLDIFRCHAAQMQKNISAADLEKILNHHLDVQVAIQQNIKKTFTIDMNQRLFIGSNFARNYQLGINTVLGATFFDRQYHFRIQLGPLSYQEFQSFLADRHKLTEIKELVRRCVGLLRSFDLELLLKSDQLPNCQLMSSNFCLGWNTWLGSYRTGKFVILQREFF